MNTTQTVINSIPQASVIALPDALELSQNVHRDLQTMRATEWPLGPEDIPISPVSAQPQLPKGWRWQRKAQIICGTW